MSRTIFENLQEQKTILETVPTYGAIVSFEPPTGEDPDPQIFLDRPLTFETDIRNERTQTSAIWTAVVARADPENALEKALAAQDSMFAAFASLTCRVGRTYRLDLARRPEGANYQTTSIGIEFTTQEAGA